MGKTCLAADAARQRTDAVLSELDGIIRQIRSAAFNERTAPSAPSSRRSSSAPAISAKP